ncbi:MAG: nucleotidyl transferase AbiEii/AbiGii toxin family protein [Candidatus Marinimicrobia bacterium]|nr:nucleotidyl transferase AbiEii/AbiGii toxin family protein [Candidatus Neomarinimicrobiota bacterium]
MLEYTKHELDELADQTQFHFGPLEKALRLLDVLRVFNSHPLLKDQFVLKGGTALNFFHLEIPRLSVDVDLNYMGELERDQALVARRNIESIIPKVFSTEYNVEQTRESHALLQYKLGYITLHGGPDALKLDLNFIERITILDIDILEFNKWGEKLSFPTLNLIELLAGKTRAFLTRYTARDLYDLYRISELGVELDQNMLHEIFLYALLTASESHADLLPPKWDQVTPGEVQRNLQPMLIRGDHPEMQTMKDGAKKVINSITNLNQTELDSFKEFDATGEIDLELLVRSELAERISKSPAYQWKKQNLIRLSS